MNDEARRTLAQQLRQHQTNHPAVYSRLDPWAVVEVLRRVPATYRMSLGDTDRTNLIELLRNIEYSNFCQQGTWAASLCAVLQNTTRSMWSRREAVTLIGLLWTITLAPEDQINQIFPLYQISWADAFFSCIAESLDVELI